jgi:hypothetical protein
MLKKQFTMLLMLALTFPVASVVLAQKAPDKQEPGRVEGKIVRSSKDDSSLTVRTSDASVDRTSVERKVVYDSSTKWVSQYHGDRKVNNIDPAEVKDDDYVVCTGTFDKSGLLHATLISKRLSHSH